MDVDFTTGEIGRGSVDGLTTAGSLWFMGAVGVAIGGGFYMIAALAVVAGLVVLAGMGLMERHLPSSSTDDDDGSGP